MNMTILENALLIGVLVGLLAMLSSGFFLKKGFRPSFNPKKWFPRGGTKELYRSPGHLLWNWGLGVFFFSQTAKWIIEGRAGTSDSGFLTPEVIFIIFITWGVISLIASLFFIKPGQEILPGEVGSGPVVRKIRGNFRYPGYLLARNGVFSVVLGGVALLLMSVL